MEDLLATQSQLMEGMNTLFTNFKKDGSDRKTPAYIKKRLSTLESYWQEFQCNHIKLCEYDDKSHDYFSSNAYKRTFEFYTETRAHIQKFIPFDTQPEEKQLLRPATPLASGSQGTPRAERGVELQQSSDQASSVKSGQGTGKRLEDMLRKQRSNFKAFSRTISGIDLEKISERWEFEDALKIVQTRWSLIDTLHWEIDSESLEDNFEYEQAFGKYEEQFNGIKRLIGSKMWSQKYREKSTPKLEIPTFTGSYMQWVSFKDLFVEAIHSNRSLSNAQKLQFLKGKLKGEAEKMIQHLPISSENYEVSWDILTRRYDNKKLIFNCHMNTLMNLPTMQQQTAALIKKIFDCSNECLNAIRALGVDVSTWDPIIVYIITSKLDAVTHSDYTQSVKNPRDIPNLKELLDFLENKFTSLESSRRKTETRAQIEASNTSKKTHFFKSFTSHQKESKQKPNYFNKKSDKCAVCNKSKDHAIYNCETFLQMRPRARLSVITKMSACKNCLRVHRVGKCFSSNKCRECEGEHNTLLHDNDFGTYEANTQPQQGQQSNVLKEKDGEILLATALVNVRKADGSYQLLRALIDQGSQTSLITEQAAQLLGIKRKMCKAVVFGVGSKENKCKGIMSITMASIHNTEYTIETDVFIAKRLVSNLPNMSFMKPSWKHIENIQLADPEFYISRPVDILLGADVYSTIILNGMVKAGKSTPVAQQTRLGWILCGNANVTKSFHCNVLLMNDDLHKFWAIEDISDNNNLSTEDLECLDLYHSTTSRRADGKYIVRLPLHKDVDEKLGYSKPKALAQFYQLERRFKQQETLYNDYKIFMKEYKLLGHMQTASTTISNKTLCYYMPHHGVRKPESTTTSLRVVYNASQTTSSGYSLNDLMYRGPNLQQDLLLLILKWRQYKYALIADVEKAFRQIMIHPEDQRYQKILWRDSPNKPIGEYQLTTVTYGTKAAPFLTMKTFKQLAKDEYHKYPTAAKVLEEHLYMDDLLCGTGQIQTAKRLKSDLIELLKLGGFNLRKWASNEQSLIDNKIDQLHASTFDFCHKDTTKALGLTWMSKDDNFTYQCKMLPISNKLTKRSLLSEMSKIFDPLGWLSPVVIQFKLLFQKVWTLDLQWDQEVPDDIFKKWYSLRLDVQDINKIQIPRWIGSEDSDILQLHGFCDASTKGMAAVIYVRLQKHNKSSIILLAAKTKVAPLNKTISLPRLELCGAHLLSKLMLKTCQSLNNYKIELFGWCDSTAVLGWIQGEVSRWKPFVANRVRNITEIIPSENWRYVKSKENPADCASRGMSVNDLKDFSLWWKGPEWLPSLNFMKHESQPFETQLEIRNCNNQSNTIQLEQNNDNIITQLISRHSSITRVSHVIAWIRRVTQYKQYRSPYLTASEISAAKIIIVKHIQYLEFQNDILEIKKNGKVKQTSKISNLNPYLDNNGALRVGGRLRHSNLSEDMKHPLIIPHSSHLTFLIIDHAHKNCFHGGARLTLSLLRKEYWIIGGNNAVKKHIRQCVICRRHNPIKQHQIMGDLPEARTNPTRPFLHTGVDYTGFVDIKASRGRGIKTTKGYVAVFVCMVTKAVHLELVSDLTSATFLAALRRMSARRGTPQHVYSDNGTNFVGANKVLTHESKNLFTIFSDAFMTEISDMKIQWHFNAPSWPSAGGLWEAAVKSLKYHLRRVVGEQKLTYEEFTTLLSQLEACLNSRPLCAISEDANDLNYLTPAHFLSSGPVLTIYETETDERTRWKLTQNIFKNIWKRWQVEYLAQLSIRSKWQHAQPNLKLNDIVVIHDANLPAGKWALGRVIELHPGKDGQVRVVSLKTKGGVLKRPIVKISKLINNNDYQNSSSSDNKQISTTRTKKTNTTMTSFITFIMTLFMLLTLTATQTVQRSYYDISPVPSNNSIYFDRISNMRFVQDKWKLIVYYNMAPYWKGTKLLNAYYNHLNSLCSKFEQRSHCETITQQLRHGSTELEYYDRMLTTQHFNNIRKRRGLINGVGYIANSLFGVLDEHFAQQYEVDISKLRSDQKHLLSLWKNQTSIIEAENNLLRRAEASMTTNYENFNNHLIKLEKSTNIINKETAQLQIMNEFLLSTIVANNVLNKLKDIQNTLLDTITNLRHFNVHLLTPQQLREEINTISGQLSKDISLPIDNVHADLPKLYQIMRVRARMTTQYFIFEIQIPLVSRDSFDLYRTYAIPRIMGSTIATIEPIAEYLAFNVQKDIYTPISELELKDCIELENTRLCEIQKAIYHRRNDDDFCVKNNEKGNNSCKISYGTCRDSWTELVIVNKFLVSCCDKCNLRFICSDQVTTKQLTGAHIIALGNRCVIKGESFTITSQVQYTNTLNTEPDIITAEVSPLNKIINLTIPSTSFNINTNLEESFESIGARITQMRRETDQLEIGEKMTSHDVHQYVVIYIVAAVALACAIYTVWAVRCAIRKGKANNDASRQTPPCAVIESHLLTSSPVVRCQPVATSSPQSATIARSSSVPAVCVNTSLKSARDSEVSASVIGKVRSSDDCEACERCSVISDPRISKSMSLNFKDIRFNRE